MSYAEASGYRLTAKVLGLITALLVLGTAIWGGYNYLGQYLSDVNYPAKLTPDKLHSIQSDLLSEGFVVKQDLTFKDKLPDGSHLYEGVVTRGVATSTLDLYVYKDQSKAHTQFLNQVSKLEDDGYSGSYINSYSWEGLKLKSYGTVVAGDVMEGNNPYSVAVLFATGTVSGQ